MVERNSKELDEIGCLFLLNAMRCDEIRLERKFFLSTN